MKGLILEGDRKGWTVFIQDLDDGRGAFLILLTSPDYLEWYDDCVKNLQSLYSYFLESNWFVEWLDVN